MNGLVFALLSIVGVIVTLVVMHLLGIPLSHQDPFGKKSKLLINIFDRALSFRTHAIDNAIAKGVTHILLVAGEFGTGIRHAAKYSLDNGLHVTIVGGPVTKLKPEAKNALDSFLENYSELFSYFELKERPVYHFSIFGPNLFIEFPHGEDDGFKGSIGIMDAYPKYQEKFSQEFSNLIDSATRYAK